jgi:hypothetical protein
VTFQTVSLKLSEKGVEQRSDREFGRHTYHEMGRKRTLRRSQGYAASASEPFRTVSLETV